MGGAVRPQRPIELPTVGSTRRSTTLAAATLGISARSESTATTAIVRVRLRSGVVAMPHWSAVQSDPSIRVAGSGRSLDGRPGPRGRGFQPSGHGLRLHTRALRRDRSNQGIIELALSLTKWTHLTPLFTPACAGRRGPGQLQRQELIIESKSSSAVANWSSRAVSVIECTKPSWTTSTWRPRTSSPLGVFLR